MLHYNTDVYLNSFPGENTLAIASFMIPYNNSLLELEQNTNLSETECEKALPMFIREILFLKEVFSNKLFFFWKQ